MALTKLNSLAIPSSTIVTDDLTYPLTNFSSTGIDDNATSTAITIDASQKATFSNAIEATVSYRAYDSVGAVYRNVLRYDNGNVRLETGSGGSEAITAFTGGSERFRINSAGDVGYSGKLFSSNDVANLGGLQLYRDHSTGSCYLFDTTTAPYNGPLIFGTANLERMQIDASGNLLVGTTQHRPATNNVNGVSIDGTFGIEASVTSGAPITLNRKSTDGGLISLKKDGTTVGIIGNHTNKLEITGNGSNTVTFGHAQSTSSGAGIYSWHTNNALVPYNSAAHDIPDGVQSLGHGSYRWKDLYLSGGAYIGGTGSANHLDDYEEGTWTPVFSGTSTSGSLSYLRQQGFYTKVGNMVAVWFRVTATTVTTSPTGVILVINLPFVANGTAGNYSALNIAYSNNWTTSPESGHTEPNTSYIYLKYSDANNNMTNSITSLSSSDDLIGHVTYRTN